MFSLPLAARGSGRPEYRDEPCRGALTRVKGMPFRWSLNPYMGCAHRCSFCYVRAFERRVDRPAGEAYGRSLRVKTNIVAVLRREVARPRWKREEVAIGTATDPYQPAEGEFRLTRGCLEVLGEGRTPFSIVTRGPLIVRDLDVIQEAARRTEVTVHVSIPTLDREVWRRTEPGTAPPHQRLRVIRTLIDAGIRAGVGMAPIIPGLTDSPDQLIEVVRAAREAGATHLWSRVLYLQPGTREHFLEELARTWPEEAERLVRLYRGPYAPTALTRQVQSEVQRLARVEEIRDRRTRPVKPPPAPVQLGLL